MHTDARKSRGNKARSSLYAALKKFSWCGLRANQAGAGFSLIRKPDEVVVTASQAILRLLQRIHMVQLRPRPGLCQESPVQGKNLPLGCRPATTHCRRGKFLVCGCSQGTLRFSIGRIDNHMAAPLGPTLIAAQAFPESEKDSSWERLALVVLHPTRGGDFLPRPRLWG
jgi:hypothetical protein